MIRIDVNDLLIHNARIIEKYDNGLLLNCLLPKSELDGQKTPDMDTGGGGIVFDNIDWSGYRYFVMDVTMEEEHSLSSNFYFWKKAEEYGTADYSNRAFCGFLPKVKTRFVFDFNWLDSQKFFIPRTMGRLKMGVHGKPTTIDTMGRMAYMTKDSHMEVKLRIENPYLTNEMPEIPLETAALIDEMGQYTRKTWPKKCPTVSEMKQRLTNEYNEAISSSNRIEGLSKYGGKLSMKLREGNGFFGTHHDGKRWWLVDPEGYAYLSVGIDGISPGSPARVDMVESLIPPEYLKNKDPNEAFKHALKNFGVDTKMEFANYATENLKKAFGPDWMDNWVVLAKKICEDCGFNSIGNWSDSYFIENAKMPYVIPMASQCPYPTSTVNIFRDFPDVYDPKFEETSIPFANLLKKYENDDMMIGYFMRNEPNWAFEDDLLIAEELLAVDKELYSKDALIDWMQKRYDDDISAFNKAWNMQLDSFEGLGQPIRGLAKQSDTAYEDLRQFSGVMIRRYVEIPAKACKAVDKQHMNLGMRWAYVHDPILVSGYDCFDVFSINCYSFNPYEKVNRIGEITDMPVIIGEYHHGALDGTTTATGIYGVLTQDDRGKAYRNYVEQGLKSPYLVGTHYFQWMDQPPLGRFDGENYNIGLVDQLSQPYDEMLAAMRATSEVMYEVAKGEVVPYDEEFTKIPAIFY